MQRKKNVIAIVSPKGGVGKTVTTANLAAALAFIYNKRILAVDTNVSTASLGLHFDVFYPEYTIHDITGSFPVEKSIHRYHQNLHLIPASIKVKKTEKNLQDLRQNLYKATKNFEKIIRKVADDYDLVLLDCSPGFELETLASMNVAGGIIVVTNPDYPSVVTAIRALEYARRIDIPVGGVIINKVRGKGYEIRREDIEKILGMNILGEIPFDKRVPESIAKKRPIVLSRTNAKSSRAYKKIAAGLVGKKYKDSWIKRVLGIKD